MPGAGPAALNPGEAAPPLEIEPRLEAEVLRERGLHACVGPPPIVLDVGFGRGEVLLDLAATHPEQRYLGVEVSRKRLVKMARRLERARLANVRLVHAPVEYLLERVLPPASIAECWINFPDPWPKKRHFKRRLIRPAVLAALSRVLEPGARLHIATDHAGYADWIREALATASDLESLDAPAAWTRTRPARRETAYEEEFVSEGRAIFYFEYRRCRLSVDGVGTALP